MWSSASEFVQGIYLFWSIESILVVSIESSPSWIIEKIIFFNNKKIIDSQWCWRHSDLSFTRQILFVQISQIQKI